MNRLAMAGLLLTLTGCATAPADAPPMPPKQVNLPVAVSCVPADMPRAPGSAPSAQVLKAAPGHAERYQMLAEFYSLYSPWIPAAAGVIEACRAAGHQP